MPFSVSVVVVVVVVAITADAVSDVDDANVLGAAAEHYNLWWVVALDS